MILAIETSAEPASLALYDGETVVSRSFPNRNQVNVPLADEVAALWDPQQVRLECVLVGAGPGSYSGARVGLATGEAIAIAQGCPVVTLPSVVGIAHEEEFLLIGDARRGAYFRMAPGELTPKVEGSEAFAAAVEAYRGSLVSFEPVEKLPLSAAVQTQVAVVSSTAEQLVQYWLGLSAEEKQEYTERAREVIYLRPPNITKAKSPF